MGRQKARRSRPRVHGAGAAAAQTVAPVAGWHARLVENLRGVLADPDVPWSSKRIAVAKVAATSPERSNKIGDTLRMVQLLEQVTALTLAGRLDEAEALISADPASSSFGAVAAFLAMHDDDAIRQWAERLCPGALAAAGPSGRDDGHAVYRWGRDPGEGS